MRLGMRGMCCIGMAVVLHTAVWGGGQGQVAPGAGSGLPRPASAVTRPLAFEPNLGQAPAGVRFLTQTAAGTLFLSGNSLLWAPASGAEDGAAGAAAEGKRRTPLLLTFDGASPAARAAGLQPQAGVSHYFLGGRPEGWVTGVPHYAKVRVDGLYPGVDLVLYGNGGQVEFDLVLGPGADLGSVGITAEGAAASLSPEGDLVFGGGESAVRLKRPAVYQGEGADRRPIQASYALTGGRRVGVTVGPYDRGKALVVDPVFVFSTYLGGEYQDGGRAVASDAAGNVYVAGYADSNHFPTTPGAFKLTHPNHRVDAFVSKFDPTGSTLLYSTFLGGDSGYGATNAYALAVDAAGNAYLAGNTSSDSFPLANAYQPAFKSGTQAFLAKLNPEGSALLYSTYLGGTGSDNTVRGVAVDAAGDAFVAGYTNSPDFPTAAAFQGSPGGGTYDAFVAKFRPDGSGLLYSTYLGGAAVDKAFAVAVDAAGRAFVAGSTTSADFPTAAPTQAAGGGYGDAFLAELDPAGGTLLFSTYLGGSGDDSALAVALDTAGAPSVTGSTYSEDFPTLNPLQSSGGGMFQDGFLTRYQGGQVAYSTYLGGNAFDQPSALAVDHLGNAYVAGNTASVSFPQMNPTQPAMGSAPAYVSRDGGITFGNLAQGLVASEVDGFLAYPGTPGTVFAAGAYGGVFKSTDGGDTWSRCANGLPGAPTSAISSCLAYAPGPPAKIIAGVYFRGLYLSTDGGDSWSPVPGSSVYSAVQTLAADPAAPNRIFMGTNGQGFHVSSDGGATWSPVPGFDASANVTAVAFAPSNPQILYVGFSSNGILKSTDGGATWVDVSAGLNTLHVQSLAVDPTDPMVVYDGSGNGGLYKSLDGGATWQRTAVQCAHLYAVAVDPLDRLRVWAACDDGVLASDDGGGTWAATRVAGTTMRSLLVEHDAPSSPATIFAGAMTTGDAFLCKVSADGQHLLFSTFLGGTGYEGVPGLALDGQENILVAGVTRSQDLPTVAPWQAANGAPLYGNAYAVKIRQCQIDCSASGPGLLMTGVPGAFESAAVQTDCYATFSYDWDFGDGGAHSSSPNPNHGYAAAGSYTWTMTAKAGEESCSKAGSVTVVDPPVVSAMKNVAPPFALSVTGSNFHNGIRVFIDGVEWTGVSYKKPTKIKITGGKSLKAAVPKGTTKTFRFLNPDGGEASLPWGW